MKSFGIILLALATGATAHPFHLSSLFARQATTCAINTDCPATQFCAGAVCETFDDCRGTEGSCPGGSCSPVPGTVDGDAQNPTRAYECSFASASASSAGSTAASSSAAASATASVSASASVSTSASISVSVSGSASSAPSPSTTAAPGGACAVNTDCASTQYCSSANETSICALLRDCRGELGSCAGGSCVAENSTLVGDAQDPDQAFICSFVSASSSSGPAFSSAAASSSAPASASSASATAAPIPSAEPSTSAAPAPSSSPAPAPAPAPTPKPEHPKPKPSKEDSKPAPAPTTTSKPKHQKDDAWRDEHKDGQKGDDKKYCDQSKIEALLWEIKGELKGLKWEVEQLKASK